MEFLLSEEAPKEEKTEMLNSAGSGFSYYTVRFAKCFANNLSLWTHKIIKKLNMN